MTEIEKYLEKVKKPTSLEKIFEKAEMLGEVDLEKVKQIIEEKVNNYELIITDSGKYVPIRKTSFRVGNYRAFRNGDGVIDSFGTSYPISLENASKIVDGDFVMVDISHVSREKTCYVKKIIARNVDNILGEIKKTGDNYYVVPEEQSKQKLTIVLDGDNYIEGEKVVVNCGEKRSDNFYVGSIIKEIGHKDDPGVDILMEAFKYNIDNEITEEELKELDSIPSKVLDTDKIGRMDFTDKEIFTIDGSDAKDLDDAVSLELLEDGGYKLGVYIADVSEYVKEGSLLDLRARRKGTSSYLANTVIPMLPHKLSNGICSLNPNVERLVLSCVMEFDQNGNRRSYNIYKGVIKSNIKMSYEKVNMILEDGIISEGYESHVDTLRNMEDLSQKLFQNRKDRGAVEIDKPELKIIMDEKCQIIDFSKRYQGRAESIIEEFMLITNETIAEDMFKNEYPLVFRNHEEPREEKVQEYLDMLKILRYRNDFDIADEKLGQKLASSIDSTDPLSDMMKTKLLRSFRRAFYSSDNLGHYGLASSYYCHFTSPIRRYPDTTNHRLVKDFHFSEDSKEQLKNKWKKELEDISKTSSERERSADECERMVELMKTAEYMEKHIGEEFIGTVVEIYNDGMQIELDNMVEGRVRQKDLKGKYIYYPDTLSYISLDNQEDYYLGDRLRLTVSYANKEKKEIDFQVVNKIEENKHINQRKNNKAKAMEKQKRADIYYYNVNKGKKYRG